jgi:hypothetical protein
VPFLCFTPQVQGVLAALQPPWPGLVLDPLGILQPSAGVLNGLVQASQPLLMLAAPQPLGPGLVQDPPGILQPSAVVVNSTSMQAPHFGGSAYSSSSSADPTACAPTPQVSNSPRNYQWHRSVCVGPTCWSTTQYDSTVLVQCFVHASYLCSRVLKTLRGREGVFLAFCGVVCGAHAKR